jgi:hypothetical protein
MRGRTALEQVDQGEQQQDDDAPKHQILGKVQNSSLSSGLSNGPRGPAGPAKASP